MSLRQSCWSYVPACICSQARERWPSGRWAAGLGDGYLYQWIEEAPPVDYRGPLPFGRLVQRVREERPRRRAARVVASPKPRGSHRNAHSHPVQLALQIGAGSQPEEAR